MRNVSRQMAGTRLFSTRRLHRGAALMLLVWELPAWSIGTSLGKSDHSLLGQADRRQPLWQAQEKIGKAVRIAAAATFRPPSWKARFVQARTAGIIFEPPDTHLKLHPERTVEAITASGPWGFAPVDVLHCFSDPGEGGLERTRGWTFQHALWVIGAMGAGILIALVWVRVLRQEVQEQTEVMREWLRREAALREQHRELFENASDMVFTCGLRGHFTSMNKAGERITGYGRAESIGKNIAEIVAPEHSSKADQLMRREAARRLGAQELEILTKDGRRVPLEVNIRQIYSDGLPIGWQGIGRDITERKLAERALRQSEERFSKVFHSSAMAIGMGTVGEGRLIDVNGSYLEFFDHSREEVIGRAVFEPALWVNPPDREKYIRELREKGSVRNAETRFRRKSGEIRDALVWMEIVELTSETEPVLIEMLVDITEQKRAQKALEESEKRFRQFAEHIREVFWIISADMNQILYVSPAYEEIWGRSIEGLYRNSRGFLEGIHPEDRARVETAIQRHLAGEKFAEEFRIVRPDGSFRWVWDRSFVVRDQAGKIECLLGLAEDITVRKIAEEALRESEERVRLLLNSVAEGIYGLDLEGKCSFANPACLRLLGYELESDLLGKNMHDVCHHSRPDGTPYPQAEFLIFQAFQRAEGAHTDHEFLWRSDGTGFPAEYWSYPIVKQGKVLGAVVTFIDITQRKQAERDLQKAKESAEAASRAKSEFVANMSHEIRTPLNGIIGMTELVLETGLTPEQREYLDAVRSSSESLLTIINDILDFSKIESRKMDLDSVEFNLRDSLSETVKTLAVRAHQKGLELACSVGGNVPEELVGDPTRLRQIIVNLVGNAIKFTERGEVRVHVDVESQGEQESLLRFAVRDTGIGISPDKQRVIFEAFSQADGSTTRTFGGTGLGLTISSRLVEMMGGRIWVESERDRGSTFTFNARFGVARTSVKMVPQEDPARLKDVPVLVVDDNATNRRILEEMLGEWKMTPSLVEGGKVALAALRHWRDEGKPFALVLIDAQMPDMDGFTLAKRIKKNPSLAGATIMMLTSAGQRGDAARCRELGVAAYLVKPIKQSELREAILLALASRSLIQEKPSLVTRHTLREVRRKLRILLAEDNAVNREVAVRMLKKQGHTVEVATNGREVIEALKKGAFDAVLMDVQMPEMDGFAATAAIREQEKSTGEHLRIIAITAHAMKGDRERCLEAGMDGYVAKPFKSEDLVRAIEGLLLSPSETGQTKRSKAQYEAVLDRAQAVDRVEGDRDLLRELGKLFQAEWPELWKAIRDAVRNRNSEALARAAHTLKSSLANFDAPEALDAAHRLETLARQGDLARVEECSARLREEIDRLENTLKRL